MVIVGETGASYSAPTAVAGVFYYYAVVTNTITDNGDGGVKAISAISSVATVTVSPTPFIPPVPIFDGLADQYQAGTLAVPLKVMGTGSAALNAFKIYSVDNDGKQTLLNPAATEFNPTTAGLYRVEVVDGTGTLLVWKYVKVN
jgi:hypothetical protein